MTGAVLSMLLTGYCLSRMSTSVHKQLQFTRVVISLAVVMMLMLWFYLSTGSLLVTETALRWTLVCSLLFLFAFLFYGMSFLPANTFASEDGGTHHVAKLSSLLDGLGYTGSIMFDISAGYLVVQGSLWWMFFLECTLFLMIGGGLMTFFMSIRRDQPVSQ
eukprot:ANDGO_01566.mRNA.1 hypothetical protein